MIGHFFDQPVEIKSHTIVNKVIWIYYKCIITATGKFEIMYTFSTVWVYYDNGEITNMKH